MSNNIRLKVHGVTVELDMALVKHMTLDDIVREVVHSSARIRKAAHFAHLSQQNSTYHRNKIEQIKRAIDRLLRNMQPVPEDPNYQDTRTQEEKDIEDEYELNI